MMMNAQDWEYVTEGGKHAIYQYRCSTSTSTHSQPTSCSSSCNSSDKDRFFTCKLLRIKKKDLVIATSLSDLTRYKNTNTATTTTTPSAVDCKKNVATINNNNNNNESLLLTTACCCPTFMFMIHNQLKPYIDLPIVFKLDWNFLRDLFLCSKQKQKQIEHEREIDFIHNNHNHPHAYHLQKKNQHHQRQKEEQWLHTHTSDDNNNTTTTTTMGVESNNSSLYEKMQQLQQQQPTGELVYDYRFPRSYFLTRMNHSNVNIHSNNNNNNNNKNNHHNHNDNTTMSFLSIEIKPKGGYLAISPLVHDKRYGKFLLSRFQLQQRLYANGTFSRSWMMKTTTTSTTRMMDDQHHKVSTTSTSSSYDPLDFFSNDESRIKYALQCLFHCPQNNLKIWYGEELLYGHEESLHIQQQQQTPTTTITKLSDLLLSMGIVDNMDGDDDKLNDFRTLLTQIFVQEKSLFVRLRELQKLDICDSDGIFFIYDQLVLLCHGSNELAQSMIDHHDNDQQRQMLDTTTTKNNETNDVVEVLVPAVPLHHLLHVSPFTYSGSDVTRLNGFCNEIVLFQTILQNHHPELPPIETIKQSKIRTMNIINKFNQDDCLFILQSWLLSLAMNDVSIFLILEKITMDSSTTDTTEKLTRNHNMTTNQTERNGGIIRLKNGEYIQYEMKMIDFGRKYCTNLLNRRQKEMAFNGLR